MSIESKFFTATDLLPGVTRIGGLGGELRYLVEGTEKALLIDGSRASGASKPSSAS